MNHKKCYIVFPSTSLAMCAERVAKKNFIPVKLSTIPRKISHKCNVGIRTSSENMEILKKLLEEQDIACEFVSVE